MSLQLRHFLKYQFPAIGWALFIFVASSIPAKSLPPMTLLRYDKLIHIGLFLIFGLLIYRALGTGKNKYSLALGRVILSVSIVILYGVLDEIYQGTVPGRTLDVWDAVADTIGGVLAALVIYIQYRMRRHAPDGA
ncbi:MAG: VanZ family protein [Bacteroidota bacterium]|nr:VanZ family protein [Bacteroidota bacterium]